MWPAMAERVKFEVAGKPQEDGPIDISAIRRGDLAVQFDDGPVVRCKPDDSFRAEKIETASAKLLVGAAFLTLATLHISSRR
jgi:hypothetical protein